MALDLEPLGVSRRADEVFDRLRSRIFSGAFEPGEQLPGELILRQSLGREEVKGTAAPLG